MAARASNPCPVWLPCRGVPYSFHRVGQYDHFRVVIPGRGGHCPKCRSRQRSQSPGQGRLADIAERRLARGTGGPVSGSARRQARGRRCQRLRLDAKAVLTDLKAKGLVEFDLGLAAHPHRQGPPPGCGPSIQLAPGATFTSGSDGDNAKVGAGAKVCTIRAAKVASANPNSTRRSMRQGRIRAGSILSEWLVVITGKRRSWTATPSMAFSKPEKVSLGPATSCPREFRALLRQIWRFSHPEWQGLVKLCVRPPYGFGGSLSLPFSPYASPHRCCA